MKGHLHLTVSADETGRTYIRNQSFRAPLHLSKPHHDSGALVVNVVNPTAGLFDGDEVEMRVTVEPGARLVLTTPSAGRVYRARSNRPAIISQEIHVAAGGFVEFFPELFIPQAGARYHQQTRLHVEEGGEMLFCEWLAPGRVARGETFAYEELLWDTDVWHGETLIARERYRLTPADASLASLKTVFPSSHYLAFFFIGWPGWPGASFESLPVSGDVYCGYSALTRESDGVVKALCSDNLSARRTYSTLRETLYQAARLPAPSLRRT